MALQNKGLPYVILLSLFFGTSLVSTRFGLSEFPSLTFVGLRMLISWAAFLLTFLLVKRYSWPTDPQIWKHGLVLGIIGTAIPMTAFITALNYLSSGVAAIIGTTGPAISVVLAHFLLQGESLTKRTALGVVFALGGALLLTLLGETGLDTGNTTNPLGYILIFTSTLSSSLGLIYARKYVRDLSPFQITSVRALVTMLVTLPLAYLWFGIDFSMVTQVGYTSLLYSALISSFAGFILALYIITTFGVATSIMTNYMVPIVASIGGALLLDERITLGMVSGMIIILIGISLINSRQQKPVLS